MPKYIRCRYLGNSANQLACIENNNIQELDLGTTESLVSLDPAVFYSMSRLKKLSVRNAPLLEDFAIDTLMANTRLEEIAITDNVKLNSISLLVFSHLPSLRVLDLRNNSLRSLKPVEGSRFSQLDDLNISENPLDCNCTVRGLTLAGLDKAKITCFTRKDDLSADFMLTASSLFGSEATCLTPFTIKLVFMICLFLIFGLFFAISLTIQAFYVGRKKRQQELNEQDSNSLLISLPLVKSNVVSDFESPVITAWHHDLITSRSLDHLDLKDHRDLEEFTKRYYTSEHFATLKPSVAYIGDLVEHHELLDQQQHHHHRPSACDCVGHHSQHQLYY